MDKNSTIAALMNVPMSEAMPFGAGATPEGSPTMLSNMVSALLSLPKRAVDASKADTAHYAANGLDQTSQTVGPAAEMAMALAGAGAPFAEAGAAGIFGGRLAKTANLDALREAEMMAAKGMHPETVLRETNWFRSPSDHKWRFEIPDDKMRIQHMPTTEGHDVIGSVGVLVKHPELFKAYPQLQMPKMGIVNDAARPNGAGYFQTGNPPTIGITAPNEAVARSVAAHELQHGVQGIENFSFGADPSNIAGLIEKGLRKNPSLYLNEGHNFMDVVGRADPIYRGIAGEVEARNVQRRLNWTPEERAAMSPWRTQDVPYRDQYVQESNDLIRALRPNK